jgi:hypothetical protein
LNKNNKQIALIKTYKAIDITNDYIAEGESERVFSLFKLEFNGKCLFDQFVNISRKKVNKRDDILEEISAYLTLIIEGATLPPKKLKPIGSNEYEIRVGRTRLYFFLEPPDRKIVVLGHYNKRKDDQDDYINKFKRIKTQYLNQKILK